MMTDRMTDNRDATLASIDENVRRHINLPEVQRHLDHQAVLNLSNAVHEKDAVINRLRGWLSHIETHDEARECARKALAGDIAPTPRHH